MNVRWHSSDLLSARRSRGKERSTNIKRVGEIDKVFNQNSPLIKFQLKVQNTRSFLFQVFLWDGRKYTSQL